MENRFDDLDIGVPFVKDSETSMKAAASVGKSRKKLVDQVFLAIIMSGEYGATSDELEVSLGRSHQSISSALTTMFQRGTIARHVSMVRRTRSGRLACVYLTNTNCPEDKRVRPTSLKSV